MVSKMKLIAAAAVLGAASMVAQAVPLGAVMGNANWKLAGTTTENNVQAGTDETTWGVGTITGISSVAGNWAAGEGGTFLYYMIYGIADANIIGTRTVAGSGGPTSFDIYNTGATGGVGDGKIHLDIYQSAVQIPSLDQFFNANPNDRTAYGMHSLLAGLGPAYLNLEFGPGKSSDIAAADNGTCAVVLAPFETCETNPGYSESLAQLVQTVASTNLPTSGTGTFFAEVVGGTAATKWDTNGMPFGYDFDAFFTLTNNGKSAGTGTCTDAQIAAGDCMAGYINDPARGLAIPEPGSLALAGLALLGAAGVARRRRQG